MDSQSFFYQKLVHSSRVMTFWREDLKLISKLLSQPKFTLLENDVTLQDHQNPPSKFSPYIRFSFHNNLWLSSSLLARRSGLCAQSWVFRNVFRCLLNQPRTFIFFLASDMLVFSKNHFREKNEFP